MGKGVKVAKNSEDSVVKCFKGNERLREFIDFLHEHQINQLHHIHLPQIAVMGDTSSGKSSLLSAISQIQLPSNDKLTTRCPLRLRMARSEVQKACVAVKWHPTSSYAEDEAYPQKHLDGWDDIPVEIERAQQCILDQARKGSQSAANNASVARDIVEVQVFGPACVDLTLIDLPGIVRFTGVDESATLGEDIKALIHEYLHNDRCVILAVVPANVDIHNSEIMADARKVDPSTRRTIPVITKPDLIDAGAEQSVLDTLLGRNHVTDLGFHMVKCRGQKALNDGKTMQDGMKEERHFFAEQKPWCEVKDREYFGVPALLKKLATLQVRMIHESIPGILAEIESQRKAAEEELARLGNCIDSDAERRMFYSKTLGAYMREIQDHLLGQRITKGKPTAAAKEQALYTAFGDTLMEQGLGSLGDIDEGGKVIVTLEDGDEVKGEVEEVLTTIKHGEKAGLIVKPCDVTETRLFVKPSKSINLSYDGAGDKPPDFLVPGSVRRSDVLLSPQNIFLVTKVEHSNDSNEWKATAFQLRLLEWDDVRADAEWLVNMIKQNRNNDLPCFLSASVFNNIVRDFVSTDWEPICVKLLNDSCNDLDELVVSRLQQAVPDRFPRLRMYLEEQVVATVREAKDHAAPKLDAYMRNECDAPYTQNHYLFETIAMKRTWNLKHRLMKQLRGLYSSKTNHHVDTVCQLVDGAFSHNERMSNEEHAALEMQILLEAYGKVASKRVIDSVPMIIQNMRRDVVAILQRRLQDETTDEQLRELIVDPDDFTAKHATATKKLKDMETVKKAFRLMKAQRNF